MVEKKSKWLIYGLAIVFGMALIALVVVEIAEQSFDAVSDFGPMPKFELTDGNGRPVNNRVLLGKITILDFFYTGMLATSKEMATCMTELQRACETSPDVCFLSISVLPDQEIVFPKANEESVDRERKKRLILTYGSKETVNKLLQEIFISKNKDISNLLLIDRKGHLRGYFDWKSDAKLKRLFRNIKKLLQDNS